MIRESVLLVSVVVATPAAMGEVVSIQAARSNTLYEDASGSLSNGAGGNLFAGLTGTGEVRRGLLQFDVVGAIPAGSIIQDVTLHLFMTRSNDSIVHNVALHRATADWGEGTSAAPGNEGGGAPSTPNDATWIHNFFPSSLWTNAGGDFEASASAVTAVGDIAFYTWNSAQMALDAQSWLDQPGLNFGWFLLGNESANGSAKRFATEENFDPGFHPVLEVTYQVPGVGATGVLLGLAAPAMSRRRRTS